VKRRGGGQAGGAGRSRGGEGSEVAIRSAEHAAAAAGPAQFPRPGAPEVAFLGRSNVGKSSLLNRLVRRRALARTSATPGKTRLVHWYRVVRAADELWLVDLPGYGWARVSKEERRRWQRLVEGYLERRETLRLAVLLQDLRRDVGDDELLLLDWLAERGTPAVVALTKADKLPPMRRAARARELSRQLGFPAARVLVTSAEKGLGIADLWSAIDAHL
jgi:GTP-binding protein